MITTFRNDQPNEFLAIVREAGQWLTDSNNEMWHLDTLTADNLFDVYTRGNCYVMYGDGVPAATCILQWQDPLYYPDAPENTVGILHKIAVRRAFAGQGLFTQILAFCRERCRERGIRKIHLEADATRPALLQFYERNGFSPTYQRTIHEFGQTFLSQYFMMLC